MASKPIKASREAAAEPVVKGRIHETSTEEFPQPKPGQVLRYIFTSAQNNTPLFDAAWQTLQTVAAHYKARIIVSTFTYDKSTNQRPTKGAKKGSDHDGLWYDPRIAAHILDARVRVAPGLVWCGELNILPTAARPLSGFESYTGRASSIIPHAKIAMESVASGKFEATKFLYTTGTVTLRNYIQKKAGQKAEFHHGYGALLVEVTTEGWWCRQLNSDSDGVIYDLDKRFSSEGGIGCTKHEVPVESISWGDIHVGQMDVANTRACWGPGGMLDTLRPRHQFFHDVLDFRARNHHERGNPHKAFEHFVNASGSVMDEIAAVARFLDSSWRRGCKSVVVDSNHDNAMQRWLKEGDYRSDPENALFFLRAQSAIYDAIARHRSDFHLVAWALEGVKVHSDREYIYLRPDQSFIICPDANGGIECGMHGHRGVNGARGSAIAFARMGRKANVGHVHSTGIHDGIYTSGTSSNLDLGYNEGPSSWSHSHTVTYQNGKRAILTVWKGRPWA